MPEFVFRPLLDISRRQAVLFCLALTAFELLAYLASDMVMPAMLQVTHDLSAARHHVPGALYAFLLGGIAFQWLLGPLSDRFGRRPLLLAGTLVFSAACLATAACQHIAGFNLLRFVQGTALGFIVVVSYPALQETFAERDAVRLMALFANIALLSPLAGPLAGTLLLRVLSWREQFVALGMAGALITLALWRWMPETARAAPAPGSLRARTMLANYAALLRQHDLVYGSLALGLLPLPLIAWIGLSPLLIRDLGQDGLAYGLWQLPVFGAVIAGNLALNRLAARLDLPRLLRVALYPTAAGVLLLLVVAPLSPTLPALVAALSVYAFGVGLGNATLYRLTLYSTGDATGSVAALLGMLSTAMLAAGGSVLTWAGGGDSPARFAVCAGLIPLLGAPLLRRVLRPAPAATLPCSPNR
jgi:DHA1 family multidrug/chloramphenicol efflux transport protein-like MFS transporter